MNEDSNAINSARKKRLIFIFPHFLICFMQNENNGSENQSDFLTIFGAKDITEFAPSSCLHFSHESNEELRLSKNIAEEVLFQGKSCDIYQRSDLQNDLLVAVKLASKLLKLFSPGRTACSPPKVYFENEQALF